MSRVLLFLISVLVWAGAIFVVLSHETPKRVERAQATAREKLEAQAPKVALAAESLERTLLDDTREIALGMGIGAALDKLSGGGEATKPAKKKRAAAAPVDVVVPVEQAAESLKDVDEALKGELAGTKRFAMVFDKRGRVLLSAGEGGQKVGTTLRNAANVSAALDGVSQLVASGGKGAKIIAYAPTLGRDGAVNGAVAVGIPLDAAFCQSIATKSGVASFGFFDGANAVCATAAFEGTAAPAQGETVKPGPLEAGSLLMVNPGVVGVLVMRSETKVPVLGAQVVVAEDTRKAFADIADWQQQTLLVLVALLAAAWLLIGAALFVAARPADAIANHLALIHQGGKVPSLSERQFSGGFKRIVKNLNVLLEKREQKIPGGPALQPISALLAGSPDPAEQEMKFESANAGTIGTKTPTPPPEPPVEEPRKPITLTPMVQPQKPEPKPVLSPLSPAVFDTPAPKEPSTALNALFDDKTPLLDEDKTAIRPPPPPSDALPPLPDLPEAPLPKPQPLATNAEASSALGDLNGVPSGIAPPDTPWDTPASAKAGGMSAQDEEHYHQVFEEFLKVRAQCGEPTSNLTYDKFVEKLKKSRDQVMQKQNTKVVRFQVYVKDGKAALKAVAAK